MVGINRKKPMNPIGSVNQVLLEPDLALNLPRHIHWLLLNSLGITVSMRV